MSTKADPPVPPPMPASPTRWFFSEPPAGQPPLPNIDARTHALRVLAKWFAALVYRRTMAANQQPQAFTIPIESIFIEQPDAVEGLEFPSISIIPGRGQYVTRGLGGSDPDDDLATVDGRALFVPYDYTELITVEGWGSKIAERRSIVAAIEVAMGAYEGTTDLRLVMPDYFDQVATFSLMERENIDDLEVARGRRRVHLFVQMTVPVIAVARFTTLDARPGGTVKIALDMGEGGVVDGLNADSIAAATSATTPANALAAMGLDRYQAEKIARATLQFTPAQASACTDDFLLQLVLALARKNATLETWYGRPPYSPSQTESAAVVANLPRYNLP